MLSAICKGMLFGATLTFLLIITMNYLVEGTDPLLKMLKDIGFILMLTAASICGTINSVIYLVANSTEKIIQKYAIGSFCVAALFSILSLIISGEIMQNPLSFVVLLIVAITLVIGIMNLLFAAFSHMILKAAQPKKY